jgi:hypothetical protein
VRHYIRVTAGPYRGQIYQFDTKKDALTLERALNRLRPHSTDYGNDRDFFPETHLKGKRASTCSPLREVRSQLRASGRAHARKKISPHEAKRLLQSDGIDFRQDFHQLSSSEVQRILEVARLAGYRKRKDAPGSTARMYFQYLDRV